MSGCAHTAKHAAPRSEFKQTNQQNYRLNSTLICRVGDAAVSRKQYQEYLNYGGVRSDKNFRIKGGLSTVSVDFYGSPATIYEMYGTLNGMKAYKIPDSRRGLVFCIDENDRFSGYVAGITYGYSPVTGVNQYAIDPEDTKFIEVLLSRTPVPGQPYTNHEIIYSGRSGTEVFFTYREYTVDDLARPAYSQDLVYPHDTEIIQFKNYAIKLIDATPRKLTYSVIED